MPGTITKMLVFALAASGPPAAPGQLTLEMHGFRSDAGVVLVAVYQGADGFPGRPAKAWQTAVAPVTGGRARVSFAAPAGEYAAAIVHDENSNGALDTNWLGIPREGVGASNNATGRFGPPKYRAARFTVGPGATVHTIAVVYP